MVSSTPITRRSVLRHILTGAAAAGVGRFAYGGGPATHGVFVERQPTGAEIWQVTTEELHQSNLYLVSVPEGKRTELQVGKPFTTPCTGHEAWIGDTGEMLLSVSARGDFAPEKGNLLGVRAGQSARVIGRGHRFNHVGVSRCGRLFCCDDWQPPFRIVIGSTKTGKSAVVCASKTEPSRSQNTHPHAYLTPDLKWVIFNSNRSGRAHVYAARVPEGMAQGLLS